MSNIQLIDQAMRTALLRLTKGVPVYPVGYTPRVPPREYMRFDVVISPGEVLSASRGVLIVDIYTQTGKGTNRAMELAGDAQTALVGVLIDGLQLTDVSLKNIGEEDAMLHSKLSISFFHHGD